MITFIKVLSINARFKDMTYLLFKVLFIKM